MEESILADGKMESSMGKELFILQTDKRKKENGKMDKEKDGLSLKREMTKNN